MRSWRPPDWNSADLAELHQVLEAGRHEGVPWRKCGDGNRMRATIPLLGIVELLQSLADNSEVVQGVRDVGVEPSQDRFLRGEQLSQQLLGCMEVAGRSGLL